METNRKNTTYANKRYTRVNIHTCTEPIALNRKGYVKGNEVKTRLKVDHSISCSSVDSGSGPVK